MCNDKAELQNWKVWFGTDFRVNMKQYAPCSKLSNAIYLPFLLFTQNIDGLMSQEMNTMQVCKLK